MFMYKEKVIESIRTINSGSAGSTMNIIIAAYNLLEYIINNDKYETMVEKIYKYYDEEYDYELSLTTANDEIQYLLSLCCTLLLLGENYSLDEVGLVAKNYNDKDIAKFFKFANLINEKYGFELKLDTINNLQLQKNLKSQENIEKSITDTENKIIEINNRIDKIHFDTISIISIFVAVIFTLYGSTQLIGGIITNITSDNYVLMFKTALVLGLILSIIVSLLISVMSWYDKKSNRKWLIITLNLILAVITVLSWIIKIK